ncbi:unnamed protein product [Sphagnum balticum]
MRSISAALAAICLLTYSSTINAHTWTENLRLIAPNGSFVGNAGYPRGFVPRPSLPTEPDPNKILVYQLPPNGRSTGNAILDSDLICGPNQQIGNQPAGYPALKAAPKDQVALRYEENGHVSQFNLSTGIAGKPQEEALSSSTARSNHSTPMLILRSIAFGIPRAQEVMGEESFLRHDPLMMADASNRSQVSPSHKRVKRSSTTLIQVTLFASQTSRSQKMQLAAQLMVDPNAPPLVATDNLGAVQSGVSATNKYSATFYPFSPDSATSAAPATTTSAAPASVVTPASPVATSAASTHASSTLVASTSHSSIAPVASPPAPVASSPVSTEPSSTTIISTSHTSSSSIASSQGPQGFITVTVTATEHLVSTATVYVQPSSMTSITTTVYTTDLTTMTIEGPSPPQSTISTVQTSAPTSSSSSAASYINVSAPSGKYTTNTVVPSVVPFMTGGARRARGAKARR